MTKKTPVNDFLDRFSNWAFRLSAAVYFSLILLARLSDRQSEWFVFSSYLRYHQKAFLLFALFILLATRNWQRFRLLYESLTGVAIFVFIWSLLSPLSTSPSKVIDLEYLAVLLATLVWFLGIPLLLWRNASVMLWFSVCGGLLLFLLRLRLYETNRMAPGGDNPLIWIIENLAALLLLAGVFSRTAAAIKRQLPAPRPPLRFPRRDYD